MRVISAPIPALFVSSTFMTLAVPVTPRLLYFLYCYESTDVPQ